METMENTSRIQNDDLNTVYNRIYRQACLLLQIITLKCEIQEQIHRYLILGGIRVCKYKPQLTLSFLQSLLSLLEHNVYKIKSFLTIFIKIVYINEFH